MFNIILLIEAFRPEVEVLWSVSVITVLLGESFFMLPEEKFPSVNFMNLGELLEFVVNILLEVVCNSITEKLY